MTDQEFEFFVEGMHCKSCEKIIEKQIRSLKGIKDASVDYATGSVIVKFNDKKTSLDDIFDKIEEKGYSLKEKQNYPKIFGILFGIIGILIFGYYLFNLVEGISLPNITQGMSYTLLFAVGLLTGFHCIAMCGGFVVSYTASDAKNNRSSYKSHLFYGSGKLISYTIIGAIFGLIGSIIAFTPKLRGFAGIFAGLFLILFGIRMLNLFPILRKLNIRTPNLISNFVRRTSGKHSNPLIFGLLNGLMIACGPLQAIYIMAAGTGSMIEGAKLLFVFGLGTLPVMLGFGYITSFISNKATAKILKASGFIIILLGFMMMNNGLALAGSGLDFNSLKTKALTSSGSDSIIGPDSNNVAILSNNYQEIHMKVTRYGWEPDRFILQKGIPVKWIIEGEEINGCNNAIQVPKYGLEFDIKQGEQIIEFTPTESGVVSWSCWMGMIPGTFIVKDDLDLDTNDIKEELNSVQMPSGGSCGAGGGGCGCGG